MIRPGTLSGLSRAMRLGFADPELDETFRLQNAERALPKIRAALVIGALTYPPYAIGDYVHMDAPASGYAIAARVGFGLVVAACVPWTYARSWVRHEQIAISALITAATVVGIAISARAPEDYGKLINVAVLLLYLFPLLLLRFRAAAATTAAMTASVAAVLALGSDLPAGYLVPYVLFLVNASVLAVYGSYMLERAERNEFLARQAEEHERRRSERLLLNVLPPAIAARLRGGESTIVDRFPSVTILFADISGFTSLAARLPPEEIVRRLNVVFSIFDELTGRHGLEKIKTIGDAYMVVGGLPEPRPGHCAAVAMMALEMQEAIAALNVDADAASAIQLRIGIHTGAVVAGIIGTRKFSYDLWGDVVNTASRMESHGIPGAIQVTAEVYEELKDRFRFEPRGVVEVKGKGTMRTWLLAGSEARPAVAVA